MTREEQINNFNRLWLEGAPIPLFSITLNNPETCSIDFIFNIPEYKANILTTFALLAPEFPKFMFPSTFCHKIRLQDNGDIKTIFSVQLQKQPSSHEDEIISNSIITCINGLFDEAFQEYIHINDIFNQITQIC